MEIHSFSGIKQIPVSGSEFGFCAREPGTSQAQFTAMRRVSHFISVGQLGSSACPGDATISGWLLFKQWISPRQVESFCLHGVFLAFQHSAWRSPVLNFILSSHTASNRVFQMNAECGERRSRQITLVLLPYIFRAYLLFEVYFHVPYACSNLTSDARVSDEMKRLRFTHIRSEFQSNSLNIQK